ncbi:MAG TPA: hypothetical protein VGN08_02650 [Solirubrobacteraceae bacterium]|jgi:hypothetical protein
MKVTRVGRCCLLAVLSIAVFAVSSASAASLYEVKGLPEIGKCVKTPVGQGIYAGSSCITVAKKAGTGKYEWTQVNASEKQTFKGTGGETKFVTAGHGTIKCIDANLTGEWRGPKTATVEIEFQGCENSHEQVCQTTPPNKSEIKTLPLEGELGFIKNQVKEGKPLVTIGLDLKPQSPLTELATYECGGGPSELNRLEGSVIGEIKPIDKMTLESNLVYRTTSAGNQLPESFQEAEKDTLTTTFQSGLESTSAPTALKIKTYVGKNTNPLEIKAKEN